jgi:transcriptional regulator with XRE-family HTH domain
VPSSTTLATLGERVRRARVASGLSQAQLGAPHFTRAYVSAIELGKIRPAVRSLEFLAAKLGRPAGYFLGEDEATARQKEHVLIAKAKQQILAGEHSRAVATLTRILEARRS